ncbi:MAG: hypothetical protein M1374_01250 [Firmicutes bacterium]|jgi:hypothetical protein|nr:hypothetical protein [Bacillota bacterium]
MTDKNKVLLTKVSNIFHAQVLAARLESEGYKCYITTPTQSLTPFPLEIDIFVDAAHLEQTREILLFDSVEEIFTSQNPQKKRTKLLSNKWWISKRLKRK